MNLANVSIVQFFLALQFFDISYDLEIMKTLARVYSLEEFFDKNSI